MNLSDIAILNIKSTVLAELPKVGHELNAKYQFEGKKWNILKHENLL